MPATLHPITKITGKVVPVPGANMDTDRIIPARFLKCVTFDELAGKMFYDERFNADGSSKGHPIDDPQHVGASILIGGENFGCGSSREHAPQAIKRSGIRAVVAESFAEIFFGNSSGIGLPCVCANAADLAIINAKLTADDATYRWSHCFRPAHARRTSRGFSDWSLGCCHRANERPCACGRTCTYTARTLLHSAESC